MIIISTSLTVPTQPSPRFHVEACLPFRNREMDYTLNKRHSKMFARSDLFELKCLHATKRFEPTSIPN